MTLPTTAYAVLAQAAPPGSDQGEEFGKTSPIALVVILLLGLATALLIRSMNKRLRNVPASFDPPEAAGPDDAGPDDAGPDDSGRQVADRRAADAGHDGASAPGEASDAVPGREAPPPAR